MKVWVIESSADGYETVVVGVASSPEAARAFVKGHSYAVSWTDRPLGTIGHHEFILGKCTKHDADYTFDEYELQGEPQ